MRLKPDVVVAGGVKNQSSRDGASPSLIVLHSTESTNIPDSANDLQAVWNWFNNPAAQASSHVITDADGHSARCVDDRFKAWSCVNFNSVSLNIEQIGFASSRTWSDEELTETARWVAKWSLKHSIPIQVGAVSGTRVTKPGVVTHSSLGAAGGGHSDPGHAYPLGRVLSTAQTIKSKLKES